MFLLTLFTQTDGCSGAEIAAMCQDAALLTMQRDMDAPYVCGISSPLPTEACLTMLPQVTSSDFVIAARNVRRQITPEMIHHFTAWRKRSGMRNA